MSFANVGAGRVSAARTGAAPQTTTAPRTVSANVLICLSLQVRLKADTIDVPLIIAPARLLRLRDLASRRRDHELHQGLGDVRLQAFRVALFEPDDVGNHTPARAVRVHQHLRGTRTRQETPRRLR